MRPLESLLHTFIELHPEDAARAFETLDIEEGVGVFKAMPTEVGVPLLERVSPHMVAAVLRESEVQRAAEILQDLSPRVASSILHQLEEEKREEVLALLPEKTAHQWRALARHHDDTAGAIMEPRVASLSIDLTVEQTISAIRKAPREALHYLYVTQRDGKLAGVLNMRDLLLANPRDPIASLVRRNLVTIPEMMPSEEVVQLMREKDFLALPVVDFEGRLIGVVQHAEALQAGQEAAFEDLQTIVGAGADERALSPVKIVVKSRLPWLMVNLATAFLAASVIGVFEGLIAKVAALAVLLPVVAGQGGNTGSQSLAVVMRGLALREIIPGTQRRVIAKELLGGAINGVAIAVVTALAVFAWRTTSGDGMPSCVGLSLVIGFSMIISMVAAALAGAVIPLILRALGRDPAQSAAIFLTTVTDIVGFASFLGFATAFMPMIT